MPMLVPSGDIEMWPINTRSISEISRMNHPSEVSTDHSGVVVPPPLIYVAFFLVGMGFQRYVPMGRLPVGTGRVLGAVLVLSWLMLTTWSFRRFWASGTSIVPIRPTTALVIDGPYRLTRNPMYVGLLLAGLASCGRCCLRLFSCG